MMLLQEYVISRADAGKCQCGKLRKPQTVIGPLWTRRLSWLAQFTDSFAVAKQWLQCQECGKSDQYGCIVTVVDVKADTELRGDLARLDSRTKAERLETS